MEKLKSEDDIRPHGPQKRTSKTSTEPSDSVSTSIYIHNSQTLICYHHLLVTNVIFHSNTACSQNYFKTISQQNDILPFQLLQCPEAALEVTVTTSDVSTEFVNLIFITDE